MSIELYGYVLTRYLNICGYVFISLFSRGANGKEYWFFLSSKVKEYYTNFKKLCAILRSLVKWLN